jgi:hypothetical protein
MSPLPCLLAVLSVAGAANDLAVVRAGRQALFDDAAFRGHTLAVSLRNNSAVVWGAVPDRDLADRAIACVRQAVAPLRVQDELLIVEPARANRLSERPSPPPAAKVTSQFRPEGKSAIPGVRLGEIEMSGPTDITGAVQIIQKTDPRYARLRSEIKEGVIRINGRATAWADVWAFAHSVGKLPGVTAVRIGSLTVGRD